MNGELRNAKKRQIEKGIKRNDHCWDLEPPSNYCCSILVVGSRQSSLRVEWSLVLRDARPREWDYSEHPASDVIMFVYFTFHSCILLSHYSHMKCYYHDIVQFQISFRAQSAMITAAMIIIIIIRL